MSELTHRLLVAYDIVDDRRRSSLANVLSRHGDRVQYSVFVVDARSARRVRLESEISDIIDRRVDSVLICDIGPAHDIPPSRLTLMGVRRVRGSGDGPLVL